MEKEPKGWWKCKCGQESGKGFKLCPKCLRIKPKIRKVWGKR